MEYLSIIGVPYDIDQLGHLCEQTPRLRYLKLHSCYSRNDEELQTPISSITKLNLVFDISRRSILKSLLQHVPNLSHLTITTDYVKINGYEWEQVIRHYLPKLKVFQMKMLFSGDDETNNEELFNSFQTRFWLEERQWFVRYHYPFGGRWNMACLYTLPYSFTKLEVVYSARFRSTCPNDHDYQSYNYVQHLLYHSPSTKQVTESDLNFPNVNHLSIELPVDNHLLSIVRRCSRLTSLEVSRPNNMSNTDTQSQLQTLLTFAPHIDSLKFNSWSETEYHNEP
jgi:hypothetical protein